jgi:hypothetical protein
VDPLIQSPTSTQSVNPYSYIMNNPLAGTDPTGYAGVKASCFGPACEDDGDGGFIGKLTKKSNNKAAGGANNGADGQAASTSVAKVGSLEGNAAKGGGTNEKTKVVDSQNLPPIEHDKVPSYSYTKKHWQEGKGRDMRIPTSAVDFSDLDISDTPQIQKIMDANGDADIGDTFAVTYSGKADNLPYETVGTQYTVLGTISLKVEGSLIKVKTGWKFSGQFKSFDDKYDFNSDWSRPVRQVLTWGARKDHGEGTPYNIQIRGAIKREEEFD